ncbi:UNVERIFIED_CONTAM: Kinesin-like protein KIN-UB [Sesamum calycinum]|uniref:Vacuolar protein 8 n=1 Tax=Sesamum calycinum TaxID=2727403 RepID=A0AAW2T037_9LAMI
MEKEHQSQTFMNKLDCKRYCHCFESEDANVRIHAVKVVANLAAEEGTRMKTIRRIAAGAIANLAMNESNQELIMAQGGICLLAMTAADAEDPQTLRMVAGAIANLCGNDKLQTRLRSEGGIKALLGMVRCRHPDVLSQVARGIANFAKCESRASSQEVNAKDMISGGALWELVRISRDCSREDIRALARRTLASSSTFQAEMRRLRIEQKGFRMPPAALRELCHEM